MSKGGVNLGSGGEGREGVMEDEGKGGGLPAPGGVGLRGGRRG